MAGAARKVQVTLPPDLAIDAEVDLNLTDGEYSLAARLNISVPGLPREVAQQLVDKIQPVGFVALPVGKVFDLQRVDVHEPARAQREPALKRRARVAGRRQPGVRRINRDRHRGNADAPLVSRDHVLPHRLGMRRAFRQDR